MTAQLDLDFFVREAVAAIAQEEKEKDAVIAEAHAFLFNGKAGYTLTMGMTVADVNLLWEAGYERADEWAKTYDTRLQPLRDQLSKTNSRDRKARAPIKAQIAQLENLANVGHALHGEAFADAQAAISKKLLRQYDRRTPKPDEEEMDCAFEDFNGSVYDWQSHEMTWLWTLQDCADIAIAYATDPCENGELGAEFQAAYLKARRRSGKITKTRAEIYREHYSEKPCLITRLAQAHGLAIA